MVLTKQEDDASVEIVDTPQGSDRKSTPGKGILIKLSTDQTATLPYPIGCLIWFRCSNMLASSSSGIVKSISMDIVSRKLHYEISTILENESKDTNPLPIHAVPEDDLLCFGSSCPVRVKTSCNEVDGKILCGKAGPAGVSSYTVMLFISKKHGHFKVEENVAQDRIRFLDLKHLASRSRPEDLSISNLLNKNSTNAPNPKLETEETKVPHSIILKKPASILKSSLKKVSQTIEGQVKAEPEVKPSSVGSIGDTFCNSTVEDDVSLNNKELNETASSVSRSKSDASSENWIQSPKDTVDSLQRENSEVSDSSGSMSGQKRPVEEPNDHGESGGSDSSRRCPRARLEPNPAPVETKSLRIDIPSWLLGKDRVTQKKVYDHLVTDQALRASEYSFHIKGHGRKMYISASTDPRNAPSAWEVVQLSLLQFIESENESDNSDVRLMFDLAVSSDQSPGINNVRPLGDSKVVNIRDLAMATSMIPTFEAALQCDRCDTI